MFTLELTLNGRRLLERIVTAQQELIAGLLDPWKLNPRRERDAQDYLDCCDLLRQLDQANDLDEEAEAEDVMISAKCGCFGADAQRRAYEEQDRLDAELNASFCDTMTEPEPEPALDAWVNEGGPVDYDERVAAFFDK